MPESGQRALTLHPEDALRFLILKINENPLSFALDGHPPSFDVWMPKAVSAFLIGEGVNTRGDPEFSHYPKYSDIWKSFYDAAWELCRRGIFRPSEIQPEGRGTSRWPLGDGYSVTSQGAEWLRRASARYFPTERSRYVGVLEKPSRVLGDGFLQRAAEAAGCYGSGNYLACCAMSGAAAESVLLALAIAKTDDPDHILGTYGKRDGRRNVTRILFETPGLSALQTRFQTGFNLLSYWRDEAAHGKASTLDELEANDALGRLLHLSNLAWDNWTELTGKQRPAS